MLNLAAFQEISGANGPGLRAVLWVQGCHRRCPGCFNPEMQPFVSQEQVTVEEIYERVISLQGRIEGITFSGGEPFEQAGDLARLAMQLRREGLSAVTYSGYRWSELKRGRLEDWKALLKETDLLIAGPYVERLRAGLPWRGSSNQRLIYLSDRLKGRMEPVTGQVVEVSVSPGGAIRITGFPPSGIREILLDDLSMPMTSRGHR